MYRFRGFQYPMTMKRALRPAIRRVRYMGLRPEDVLIASYPRSGSTWLRFVLTEVLAGETEWDAVNEIVPYVGEHRSAPALLGSRGRLVKTHELTPGPCKRAAYLVRDPRDVVLSEHRLSQRGGSTTTLRAYVPRWLEGKEGPFGRWDDHVHRWLDGPLAADGDLLTVRFEDLKARTAAVVSEVLEFLGVATEAGAVERAVEANTLARMKEKEDRASPKDVKRHDGSHRFVGEGAASGWRRSMPVELSSMIEEAFGPTLERLGYDTHDFVQP